jgi:tetratricopeptide (TPR) repeat protein
LGHALFDQNQLDEAKAAYVRAVQLDPQALDAHLGLARLKAKQGDTDGAIAELTFVLGRQKGNLFALLSRAQLKLKRGSAEDLEGALQDTAQAMLVDAKNGPVLYTRGLVFLAAGKADHAQAAFELLASVHPSSPLAPYGLAKVFLKKGDRPSAIDALKRAKERATPSSGFSPDELRKDPAFAELSSDPAFASAVGP